MPTKYWQIDLSILISKISLQILDFTKAVTQTRKLRSVNHAFDPLSNPDHYRRTMKSQTPLNSKAAKRAGNCAKQITASKQSLDEQKSTSTILFGCKEHQAKGDAKITILCYQFHTLHTGDAHMFYANEQ